MHIILISPDFGNLNPNGYKIMPLTMYHIAAMLQNSNNNIEVIDPCLYENEENFNNYLFERISDCELIAFSANSFNLFSILDCITNLKKHRLNAKIIVGGIHAAYCYSHLQNNDFDYILLGEAEIALPIFVRYLQKEVDIDCVPNLVYKVNNKIVENKIAPLVKLNDNQVLPMYELVPKNAYDFVTIETSRGCIGNCAFCSTMWHKKWRCYPDDIILRRIKYCVNKLNYDFEGICFTDDCFTTNKNRAKLILKNLLDMNLEEKSIMIEARMKDLFDVDMLKIMKHYNYINIQVGIECGYNAGLDRVGKAITLDDIENGCNLIKENLLSETVLFSFIIGFPWETEENCISTLTKAAELYIKYGINVNCSWWIPLPSELLNLSDTENKHLYKIYDQKDWYKDPQIFLHTHPNLNLQTINKINDIVVKYRRQGISLFN